MERFEFSSLKGLLELESTSEVHLIKGRKPYITEYLGRDKKATGRCEQIDRYRQIEESDLETIKNCIVETLVIAKDIEIGGIIQVDKTKYKVFMDRIDDVSSIIIRRIKGRCK